MYFLKYLTSSVRFVLFLLLFIRPREIKQCLEALYFIAEPHLKECVFVAFLKFLPIVQSGSILFRKLDRERRGKDASPYLRLPAIGCG